MSKVAPSNEVRSQAEGVAQSRGQWGGKAEFVLTLIGSAVGLGNIWRFPFLAYKNGGGAFFIPYFIALLFLGLPLFAFEIFLGQFGSLGHTKIWTFNPLFKGVGYGMEAFMWILGLYYNVIIAWAFYFLFAAMTSVPPWSNCENSWNTITCMVGSDQKFLRLNNTALQIVLRERGLTDISNFTSPTEEFFYGQVLKRSGGIDQPDGVVWQLALCLLLVWVIVFLVLMKGINSLGKSAYFATLFPYVMLLAFLIRGSTLPGARTGVEFYMVPKWSRLMDRQTWTDAATQIFFSLNIGSGALISLGSYNKFHNNAFRDSLIVCFVNCLTSIFAGFAIFTVLGFMADEKGVSVDSVATAGPGLVFIVYPEGLSQMPAPTVWAVLFFLMMVVLGFSSSFSLTESVFIAIMDEFPHIFAGPNKRRNGLLFRGISCAFFYLISLPLVTRGGFYLFDIIQDYHSGFPLLILAIFELMAVFWIYGYRLFMEDILMMMGWRYKFRDFGFHLACWLVISPLILVAVVILKATDYKPYTSGDYEFPGWAHAIGWLVVAFHFIWIFVVFIYRAAKDKNCKLSSSPEPEWGPALPENRTGRYAKADDGLPAEGAMVELPPPYSVSEQLKTKPEVGLPSVSARAVQPSPSKTESALITPVEMTYDNKAFET